MLASALMNSTTTIEVRKMTLEKLKHWRDPVLDRNWSDAIEKAMVQALNPEADIYVKVITIDGFIADSAEHEIIFQLGTEPPHYYRYFNGKFEELPELPKIKAEIVH